MSAILELDNVFKSYSLPGGEELPILRQLNLTIEPAEVVAITGRSGSGKSTLLNLLGLLDQPTRGSFRCEGVETASMSDGQRSHLRGQFFGFIFQQFHLIERRTALDNVAEPLLFAGRANVPGRRERAAAMLEKVGLNQRLTSMPHLLSGGEQQRVAIARALVRSPRVILADEPTGSLDIATGESVMNLLLDLVRQEEVSLVLVTHEAQIARQADRILELHEGQLVEAKR